MARSGVAAELMVCLSKPQSCDTTIGSTPTTARAGHPIFHLGMIRFDFKEGYGRKIQLCSNDVR